MKTIFELITIALFSVALILVVITVLAMAYQELEKETEDLINREE